MEILTAEVLDWVCREQVLVRKSEFFQIAMEQHEA